MAQEGLDSLPEWEIEYFIKGLPATSDDAEFAQQAVDCLLRRGIGAVVRNGNVIYFLDGKIGEIVLNG